MFHLSLTHNPERGHKKNGTPVPKTETIEGTKTEMTKQKTGEGTFAKATLLQNHPFVSSRDAKDNSEDFCGGSGTASLRE